MHNYAIGIDLGTSTSEICVYRYNEPTPISDSITKRVVIPSIVAFNSKGEVLVGDAAKRFIHTRQAILEVKRLMGTDELAEVTLSNGETKKFRPEEISALILGKLKGMAETALNVTIKDVVISVPGNFPDAARQATINAAEIAGLNVLRIINEPTAAALAFGVNNLELEEQMVVFDFGGGTLDITVLEMIEGVIDVKCCFGDRELGGKEFDEVMIDLVLNKFRSLHPDFISDERHRSFLKIPCEQAKIELSENHTTQVVVANFYSNAGEEVDLDIEVTRLEFEAAIETLLERARVCIRETLKAKGLRPSNIERILLVGGTTYIPAVRRMVTEMFGKQPSTDVHPDLAVTMGASVQAALLKGQIDPEKGIILADVIPFSLGVSSVTVVGYQQVLVFSPLIERNQKLPYSGQTVYQCLDTDQEEVQIEVYQDNTGKAKFPDEAEYTGISGTIFNIPPSTNGKPHTVVVDFTYSLDGVAHLKASIPAINKSVHISYAKSAKRMDADDIEASKKNVAELWRKSAKAKNFEGIIDKAERILPTVPPSDSKQLSAAIASLKQAITSGNDDQISAAGDALVDILYEIES